MSLYCSLVQETIPKHPEYKLAKYQKLNKAYLAKLLDILKEAEILKESINKRAFLYEEPTPSSTFSSAGPQIETTSAVSVPPKDDGLNLVQPPKALPGAQPALPKASEKYRGKHSIFGGALEKKTEPRRPEEEAL